MKYLLNIEVRLFIRYILVIFFLIFIFILVFEALLKKELDKLAIIIFEARYYIARKTRERRDI